MQEKDIFKKFQLHNLFLKKKIHLNKLSYYELNIKIEI